MLLFVQSGYFSGGLEMTASRDDEHALCRDTWEAMSEQNVEVVRRMYEARDSGDAAGALAQFHPEVVVDATARGDTEIGHGREELTAIIAEWTEAFDEWREEVEEMRDLEDKVYVVATQRGRGKESGVEWKRVTHCSTRYRTARSPA